MMMPFAAGGPPLRLNKTVLEELQAIESIECLFDGEAALAYLTDITATKERVEEACPDIIFPPGGPVDLNMPVVDGAVRRRG